MPLRGFGERREGGKRCACHALHSKSASSKRRNDSLRDEKKTRGVKKRAVKTGRGRGAAERGDRDEREEAAREGSWVLPG